MAAATASATAIVNSFGYGTVTLQLTGLPAGVSGTLNPSSLVKGSVTITFKAAKTAAKQTVPITLWGISGSRIHSVTFYLTVSPN